MGEFNDISYDNLDCKEEDSVKIFTFNETKDLVGFMKKNNLDLAQVNQQTILVRDESIYGSVSKVS